GLEFASVPFIFELSGNLYEYDEDSGSFTSPDDDTKVKVEIAAGSETKTKTETLEPGNKDEASFPDSNQIELDFSDFFSDPPDDDVTLDVTFTIPDTEEPDNVFIGQDDALNANAYLRIPFAFNATKDIELLGFDSEDDFFELEDDLFNREDADDLQDGLSNFKSVTLQLDDVKNTTGLSGIEFRMTFGENGPNASETIVKSSLTDDTEIDILEETFNKMRDPDNFPLRPRLYLKLPEAEETPPDAAYELKYNGELSTRVTLDVSANIEQRFDLGGNDEEER
ncbi:MAG: hypothetical protein ACLFM0_09600, partial [Spirochaetales bacterium]